MVEIDNVPLDEAGLKITLLGIPSHTTVRFLRERHCPRRPSCRPPCWAGQTGAADAGHGGRQAGHSSGTLSPLS